jgi:hypothetical protein
MKTKVILAAVIVVGGALLSLRAVDQTTARNALNAADYGLVEGNHVDAGDVLCRLFADAANGCVIDIPPGDWYCYTPVKWLDKEFVVRAPLARLHQMAALSEPMFTFGCSAKNERCLIQRIDGLELWAKEGVSHPIGFKLVNTKERAAIEHAQVWGFDTAIQQLVEAGSYAYFNTLADVNIRDCRIAVEQTGTPDPKWGLQAACLRIDRMSVTSGRLESVFDLKGRHTYARQVTCQGPAGHYLFRATDSDNDIEFQYYEVEDGITPCRASAPTAEGNKSVLRVTNRSKAEWLSTAGNIQILDAEKGVRNQ